MARRLRDAIDRALTNGVAAPDGIQPTDGEGYWCIALRATGAQMESVPLGYTDEVANCGRNVPDWVVRKGGRAVQAMLAGRGGLADGI